MKKIISLMVVMVLCIGLVCTAYAAGNSFVPSISYKDSPDIIDTDDYKAGSRKADASSYHRCLIVTSVIEAREKTTDISQEDRDLLLDVYKKLSDGSMKLPLDYDYVIRELVHLSWADACKNADHKHMDDNSEITVTFDLGVKKGVEVEVLGYEDGEWFSATSVKNNGDGTITVQMKYASIVAFVVK